MKTLLQRKPLFIMLWALLFLGAAPLWRMAIRIQPPGALPERWQLPERIGGWTGQTLYYSNDPDVRRPFTEDQLAEAGLCPVSGAEVDTISPAERRLLPDDIVIERKRYRNEAGQERTVILLVTGESREGIHRPEWCLAAQGLRAGDRRIVEATDRNGQPFRVAVHPMIPQRAPDGYVPDQYFIYWFEGRSSRTPYNGERVLRMGWERLRDGRVPRWAYLSMQVPVPEPPESPDLDRHLAEAAAWLANGMEQSSGKPAQNSKSSSPQSSSSASSMDVASGAPS